MSITISLFLTIFSIIKCFYCKECGLKSTDGLLIVDVQNCFMESVELDSSIQPEYSITSDHQQERNGKLFVEAGSLAVKGTAGIIPIINDWINNFNQHKAPIFLSLDWHPANHCSFCRNGTNSYPGTGAPCGPLGPNTPNFNSTGRCVDQSAINLYNENSLMQWPDHCVRGTFGSRVSPYLKVPVNSTVVKKGFNSQLDSYSSFGGALTRSVYPFWNDTEDDTILSQQPILGTLIKQKKINRLFVVGIATDYCVKMSAIDAVLENFGKVFMITSAARGVSNSTVQSSLLVLNEKGVRVTNERNIDISDVLQEICESEIEENDEYYRQVLLSLLIIFSFLGLVLMIIFVIQSRK